MTFAQNGHSHAATRGMDDYLRKKVQVRKSQKWSHVKILNFFRWKKAFFALQIYFSRPRDPLRDCACDHHRRSYHSTNGDGRHDDDAKHLKSILGLILPTRPLERWWVCVRERWPSGSWNPDAFSPPSHVLENSHTTKRNCKPDRCVISSAKWN